MKKAKLLQMLMLTIVVFSCEDIIDDDSQIISKEKITGFVQKGPYLNGTSITISELTNEFVPTGKNFSSQIIDNKGAFEIKNVELNSQYVELKADGFYYNEVIGENSSAQLTLYALSDLTDKSSVNVNILSSLEKSRVNYLLSNGEGFTGAKEQAQKEILSIFNIAKEDISESELLDISKSGDDNAILLAISIIIQGHLPVSELSELLANMSTDIMEDGVLNNESIGSKLIGNANSLSLTNIRQNLEDKYEEMGLDIEIPSFEKYVSNFIDSTGYESVDLIQYPETGNNGRNILNTSVANDTFYTETEYSLAAILPENGSLKIVMKNGLWYYSGGSSINWNISDYDSGNKMQTFTNTLDGEECDLKVLLSDDSIGKGNIEIEYYEFNSTTPTKIRNIVILNTAGNSTDTYKLSVNGGSGSGDKKAGDTINIRADQPSLGYEFDSWVGDIAYVSDIDKVNTFITMPDKNISIFVVYKIADPTPESYTLTVYGGTGGDTYLNGTIVAVAADPPQEGFKFDKWTGDISYLDDEYSAMTTMEMPNRSVRITATYTIKL